MAPRKTVFSAALLGAVVGTLLVTAGYALLLQLAFNSLADVHMTFKAAFALLLVARWVLDGVKAVAR